MNIIDTLNAIREETPTLGCCRSFLQIAKEHDNYNDLYDFILKSEEINGNLHLLINPKGQACYMRNRNPFACLIEFNSCMETDVIEYINHRYPTKINMKSHFSIAYSAILDMRKQLVICYTETGDKNRALKTCMGWLDCLIHFCRTEQLHGALGGYLHLYGRILNIVCGEDIY